MNQEIVLVIRYDNVNDQIERCLKSVKELSKNYYNCCIRIIVLNYTKVKKYKKLEKILKNTRCILSIHKMHFYETENVYIQDWININHIMGYIKDLSKYYILKVNPNDILNKELINYMVTALNANPSIDLIKIGSCWKKKYTTFRYWPEFDNYFYNTMNGADAFSKLVKSEIGSFLNTNIYVCRMDLLLKALEETNKTDWELLTHMILNGKEIITLDQKCIYFDFKHRILNKHIWEYKKDMFNERCKEINISSEKALELIKKTKMIDNATKRIARMYYQSQCINIEEYYKNVEEYFRPLINISEKLNKIRNRINKILKK